MARLLLLEELELLLAELALLMLEEELEAGDELVEPDPPHADNISEIHRIPNRNIIAICFCYSVNFQYSVFAEGYRRSMRF